MEGSGRVDGSRQLADHSRGGLEHFPTRGGPVAVQPRVCPWPPRPKSPGSALCATTTTSSSAFPIRAWPSSWDHCRAITIAAESSGYDSILLPSGYALGIDSTAFAAAVATQTRRINLLLAVRMGELVVPQLARQLATIDQISGGRLVVNVISSDVPGEVLPGPDRYRRTLESMAALRSLMSGRPVEMSGTVRRSGHRPAAASHAASGRCPRSTSAGCPRRPRRVPPQAPTSTSCGPTPRPRSPR